MRTSQTYEEDKDTSALDRLDFWEMTLDMAKAPPLLGIGYKAYNPAADDDDFSRSQYGRQRGVHHSLLAVAAELGSIGLTLYLLLFLTASHTSYRRHHSDNPHPSMPLSPSPAALSTSLITFIVRGFFVAFQYQQMLWHYLGLTFAVAEIARQASVDSNDLPALKGSLERLSASGKDQS